MDKKKRRHGAVLTAVLLLAALLSACGSGARVASSGGEATPAGQPAATAAAGQASPAGGDRAAAAKPELTTLAIGAGRDTQLAPLVVAAKEEGFFQAEGLSVDVKLFAAGPDVTAAVAGKSIQFGVSGDIPLLIAGASGVPIRVISQYADLSGVQTLVVNPAVIKQPSDLNGKKIAYVPGTVAEVLFLKVVEHYGLDAKSIQVFKMGPTEVLPAFQKKDIDAFLIWQPTALNGVKNGGISLLTAKQSFVPGQEGPQTLLRSYGLLFGHNDFLTKNPNTVKAVLRALDQAAAFVQTNPDKAAAETGKEIGLEPEAVKQILPLNTYTLDVTPQVAQTLEELSQFLLRNNKIKAVPDIKQLIDPSYLQQIKPEAVSWKP